MPQSTSVSSASSHLSAAEAGSSLVESLDAGARGSSGLAFFSAWAVAAVAGRTEG